MGFLASILFGRKGSAGTVRPLPTGATLLIDGDTAAAEGWPGTDQEEQRNNLLHYVEVLDGDREAKSIVVFTDQHSMATTLCRVETAWSGSATDHIKELIVRSRTMDPLVVTNHADLFSSIATVTIGDLQGVVNRGRRIVDIGEPRGYKPSSFYRMEHDTVRNYWNYFRDFQP